jgi:hypothetical protein
LAKVLDGDEGDLAADSLLRLAGLDFLDGSASQPKAPKFLAAEYVGLNATQALSLTLSQKPLRVAIGGFGTVTGVNAQVLQTLAVPHLEAAGAGRVFEDYPLTCPLRGAWAVDEEGVRKRIARLRRSLRKLAIEAGPDPLDESAWECLELCVSSSVHAGFRYSHALKRLSNMIAS